jgi:phage shock protein A
MSGLSDKSAFEAFNRMEEKISQNERQLTAAKEIEDEFTGDKLSSEFKQLERHAGGASADLQLSALKERMGMLSAGSSAPPKALAAGAETKESTPAAKATGEADLIAQIEGLR